MAFPCLSRSLLAVSLALAACGDDKNTSDGSTTTVTTAPGSTTGGATDTATTGTPTTGTPTSTGPVSCDQPEPAEDCICAPTCGFWQCVDDVWSCECAPCGPTDPDTDTDGEEPATTGTTGEPGTTGTTSTTSTTGGVEGCDPDPFPPLHNPPCAVDDECAVVSHMVDCCGTIEVWGIALEDADAFLEAEETCAPKPICDCAPKPTRGDDGMEAEKPDFFTAACLDGLCQSVLK